jgi:hypothetical protein
VLAGNGVQVQGTGNSSEPYVISLAPNENRVDLGAVVAGGQVSTADVVTNSFYKVNALGALYIYPPTALGVQIDYYIQNSEGALVDVLGTVFWDGGEPVMTSFKLWITLISIGGSQWIGRGGVPA